MEIGLIVPIVAILVTIGLPLLLVFFVVRALINRRDQQRLSRDEREQLQRTWELLVRLEERIANLETIIMSRRARDADPLGVSGGSEGASNRWQENRP